MATIETVTIDENSWYFSGAVGRAFLFRGKNAALLVDTTNGPANLREIITGIVGDLPIILLNTHADSDHIGCNNQFKHTYLHPSEFAYYALKKKEGYAEPVAINEGDTIDIGGRVFEVILTPGHTYGSICLLNRAERFLVGGDSFLTKVFIFGPQRNPRALIASLKKVRDTYLGAFDTIYTSHFDFPLPSDFILKELDAAEALLAGELEGKDAGNIPLEPPEYRPAALYTKGESGFFDYKILAH